MPIHRNHQSDHLIDPIKSSVILSDCERYRYKLQREWDENKGVINFVMLNPSTATETADDPTAQRCETRARSMGYGSFVITNLFALRATDPKELTHPDINPVDDGLFSNDSAITQTAQGCSRIICAWGDSLPKKLAHRAGDVFKILQSSRPDDLYHLGVNKSGNPKHPLYIGYDVSPIRIGDTNAFLKNISR